MNSAKKAEIKPPYIVTKNDSVDGRVIGMIGLQFNDPVISIYISDKREIIANSKFEQFLANNYIRVSDYALEDLFELVDNEIKKPIILRYEKNNKCGYENYHIYVPN